MNLRMAREVLGVTSESTPDEVRLAFRSAAKRAHPDSGGDEGAFQQVVEAYRCLQDPTEPPPSEARLRRRSTVEPDLEITPRIALEGGDVDHRLPDNRLIRITLPPGLRSGDKVRAGGVELGVYIRAEDGVLVRGDDVWMTLKVSPSVLRKGGRLSVDTPLGRRRVWVDRKAAERGLLRIEGEGLPAKGRRPRGHLFLRLTSASGLAESAALGVLRRFAANWAHP
jgi:curved DNA-binding protein